MSRLFLILCCCFPIIATAQTVTLEVVSGTASESGPVDGIVRFTRTGSTATSLRVNNTLSAASTAANADYSDNNSGRFESFGQIDFAPGQSTFDLVLTPTADNLVEGQETLIFGLAEGSYTIGTATEVQIDISDDPPVINLSAVSSVAEENGPAATIVFERSGGNISAGLTVNSIIDNASTATGADYSDNNSGFFESFGRIDFASDQSVFNLVLTATADNLVEGEETLIFSLGDGSYTLGAATQVQASITDDPPVVSLSATTPIAAENGSPAVIAFSRNGGDIDASLTVNSMIDSSSTASGSDYSDNNSGFFESFGRIDFAVGENTFDLVLTPTPDNLVEGDETLAFSLASGNYLEGADNSVLITIGDDSPVVTLTTLNSITTEGGLPAVIRFSRSGGDLNSTLRTNSAIDSSSTASTADFSDNNSGFFRSFQRVDIAANEAFFDLELSAIQDGLIEDTETLDFSLAPGAYLAGGETMASITFLDALIFSDSFEASVGNKSCDIRAVQPAQFIHFNGDSSVDLNSGLIWRTCSAGRNYLGNNNLCADAQGAERTTSSNVVTVFNAGSAGDNEGYPWRLATPEELDSVGLPANQCLVR